MKSREQLNTENYQQAVKFANHFAKEELKAEYLAESLNRYQFEQGQKNHSYFPNDSQKNHRFSPLATGAILSFLLAGSLFFYWKSERYQIVQKGEQMHQAFQVKLELERKEDKNDRYIENLQNRLRENPNDGNLWYELGQAYALNNEFSSAQICYDNAQKLLGEKAAILGAMATADYYNKRQKLSPEAKAWLERALALDPKESTSLLLLASDSFLHNDYAQAIVYWRKVLDNENESINRRSVIQSIEMARQMLRNKE